MARVQQPISTSFCRFLGDDAPARSPRRGQMRRRAKILSEFFVGVWPRRVTELNEGLWRLRTRRVRRSLDHDNAEPSMRFAGPSAVWLIRLNGRPTPADTRGSAAWHAFHGGFCWMGLSLAAVPPDEPGVPSRRSNERRSVPEGHDRLPNSHQLLIYERGNSAIPDLARSCPRPHDCGGDFLGAQMPGV